MRVKRITKVNRTFCDSDILEIFNFTSNGSKTTGKIFYYTHRKQIWQVVCAADLNLTILRRRFIYVYDRNICLFLSVRYMCVCVCIQHVSKCIGATSFLEKTIVRVSKMIFHAKCLPHNDE